MNTIGIDFFRSFETNLYNWFQSGTPVLMLEGKYEHNQDLTLT